MRVDECVDACAARLPWRAKLVPKKYVMRTLRHIYWLTVVEAAPQHDRLTRMTRSWLAAQPWPWWVIWLLRIVVPILVQLVLEWLSSKN